MYKFSVKNITNHPNDWPEWAVVAKGNGSDELIVAKIASHIKNQEKFARTVAFALNEEQDWAEEFAPHRILTDLI